MSEKPIMPWDSTEPFDAEGRVVWWTRLDKRYQIEVIRTGDYAARYLVFDHERDDELILDEPTNLSYRALFGPDVADVAMWQERALEFVDALPSGSP
jgi:hypothetical protein